MNGSDTGACAPKNWKSLVAVVAILAMPLTGCVASGSSTFNNTYAATGTTGSIENDAMQTVPFDVVSATPEQTNALPPIDETDQAPQQLTSLVEEAPAPTELRPAPSATTTNLWTTPTYNNSASPSFAKQGPVTRSFVTPSLATAALQEDDAVVYDPAELAAQARVPALFASIDHGECKGGWGPKPTMINAQRMEPGQPYYMEMRLRHTPPLPVGHVYIAYGRLGSDGQPIDEKLVMLAPVGGYGGATVAAAVPMPGVLKPYGDDCVLRPIAAYRVSLTAQRFEQLLLEIERQKAKKPSYALFAYNCNHFMSDVAKSVGILPPKNIYTPSLQYFYEMMDRNEGRRVARSKTQLAAAN